MKIRPKLFMTTNPNRHSICFVIERIAARSGGAERILIELANWMAAQNIPVRIVTYEKSGGRPFYPLAFGVTHSNIRKPDKSRSLIRQGLDRVREGIHSRFLFVRPLRRILWYSKHGGFEKALARDLALHQPSVVVSFLPPAIVALGRVKTATKVRRIASVHNVPALDLASSSRWDPNPVDVQRRMEAISEHDLITVLLDDFRDWFPKELRSKVLVIPNPVSGSARKTSFRDKTIISVGRLTQVKRHNILIEAWAKLAVDYPDWKLEIFGEGPLRSKLEAQISALGLGSSVILKGHIKNIEAAYENSSILVHPAEYEGWGLAVTEALAHGLPVVGFSDCTGINQLIINKKNGLLVPPTSSPSNALEEALRSLMQDPTLCHYFGANGPDSVALFSPDKVYAKWKSALLNTLECVANVESPGDVLLKSAAPKSIDRG